MSRTIGIITGRIEIPIPTTTKVIYRPAKLYVTRFAGKNGAMLQLTTGLSKDSFIQLDKEQIKNLKKVLSNWETSDIDL